MLSAKQEIPLSDTRFSQDPPENGTRVDTFPDGPKRFSVNVWIRGRLCEQREFQSKEDADSYAMDAQRKISNADRT